MVWQKDWAEKVPNNRDGCCWDSWCRDSVSKSKSPAGCTMDWLFSSSLEPESKVVAKAPIGLFLWPPEELPSMI